MRLVRCLTPSLSPDSARWPQLRPATRFVEALEGRALLSASPGLGDWQQWRDLAGIYMNDGQSDKDHKDDHKQQKDDHCGCGQDDHRKDDRDDKKDDHRKDDCDDRKDDHGKDDCDHRKDDCDHRKDDHDDRKKEQAQFEARLTGRQEVPPRQTDAIARFELKVLDGGKAFRFDLDVRNIKNVVAAHLHQGPRGDNGPVVVTLYGPAKPGGGEAKEDLAHGTFTAADFQGPLAGKLASQFIALLKAGLIYVDIETDDGVCPENTGPGDFPCGEIRGQVFQDKDKDKDDADKHFCCGKGGCFHDRDGKDDDRDGKDDLGKHFRCGKGIDFHDWDGKDDADKDSRHDKKEHDCLT